MSEYDPTLDELAERNARAEEGGGAARQARQKRLGRWTARERIGSLLDEGSFIELGKFVKHRKAHCSDALGSNEHPGDGLICGWGQVKGLAIAVYAHDPTVLRGAIGSAGARKLARLMDFARERAMPLVALTDSDGARVEEGIDAVQANGLLLQKTIDLKGVIPQYTLACGLCVGAAAYIATLTDFVGMVKKQSYMFITGPEVTRIVTGENVSIESLGSAEMHARKTGACHAVFSTEEEGIRTLKYLVHLTKHAAESDPVDRTTDELLRIVPVDQRRGYDMRKVLRSVFDQDTLFECTPDYGRGLLTAFARLGGKAVALVASQPNANAGCLDIDASLKGARFVSWASSLGLPIITFVDVPGYLPGQAQEAGGIIPHGASLLTAYGTAKTPKICVILRKSFGGGSVLSYAADVRLALPTAQVAAMGADAAAHVALGPPRDNDKEHEAARSAYKAEWAAKNCSVWAAAEAGYIDAVVDPRNVRRSLAAHLKFVAT